MCLSDPHRKMKFDPALDVCLPLMIKSHATTLNFKRKVQRAC